MKAHNIRIVGGSYKRTPIKVVNAKGLRPTPNRVRETLFNWLNHLWHNNYSDKQVLDLFAGSGALGFEAASRGAMSVHMYESNATAFNALNALRERLNATMVNIHKGNAINLLKKVQTQKFDLVFLDPPFDNNLLKQTWGPLKSVLLPNSLVYVESEKPVELPEWLTPIRTSSAGQVHFSLCAFAATQNKVDNSNILNSD